MKTPVSATLLLFSALVVSVTPTDAHQRHKWWESGDIKAELGITDEQSEAIETVEAARGTLSKKRLLIVYRMHRELSVEQRTGLREWMHKNRRRIRRSPSNR